MCRFCLKIILVNHKGVGSNLRRHLKRDTEHVEWYNTEICNASSKPLACPDPLDIPEVQVLIKEEPDVK